MIAKYYLAIRPQTNDYHAVHKDGCPFMNDDSKKIFLGLFKSGQDAMRESQHSFARTENCIFCCKNEKTAWDTSSKTKMPVVDTLSAGLKIPLSYLQGMLCSLN